VDGCHTGRAPGLGSLDKLSQASGNAQAPDRESLRHACIWKTTSWLLWRHKLAHEKSRNISRSVASVAELKKPFFAEIAKVENREDLQQLRVKYWGREKGILTAVLCWLAGVPLAKREEPYGASSRGSRSCPALDLVRLGAARLDCNAPPPRAPDAAYNLGHLCYRD
jgi:hypothetical protein